MPAAFLMQQMQWREALDEAQDAAALQSLYEEVKASKRDALARCEQCLDHSHDVKQAAQEVRALMFIERFAHDLEHRIDLFDTH